MLLSSWLILRPTALCVQSISILSSISHCVHNICIGAHMFELSIFFEIYKRPSYLELKHSKVENERLLE